MFIFFLLHVFYILSVCYTPLNFIKSINVDEPCLIKPKVFVSGTIKNFAVDATYFSYLDLKKPEKSKSKIFYGSDMKSSFKEANISDVFFKTSSKVFGDSVETYIPACVFFVPDAPGNMRFFILFLIDLEKGKPLEKCLLLQMILKFSV